MVQQKTTLEDIMKKVDIIISEEHIPWAWPGQKKTGILKMGATLERFQKKKVFNIYKQKLAFIKDGKMYVTNVTSRAVRVLEENGFQRAFFHIPTASGDGPATT